MIYARRVLFPRPEDEKRSRWRIVVSYFSTRKHSARIKIRTHRGRGTRASATRRGNETVSFRSFSAVWFMTVLRALVNVILVFTVAWLVRAQHGEPINFASAAIKSDVARYGKKLADCCWPLLTERYIAPTESEKNYWDVGSGERETLTRIG